ALGNTEMTRIQPPVEPRVGTGLLTFAGGRPLLRARTWPESGCGHPCLLGGGYFRRQGARLRSGGAFLGRGHGAGSLDPFGRRGRLGSRNPEMLAQRDFSVVGETEASRFEPFFLTLRFLSRAGKGDRAEEPELGLFGSLGEKRFDLRSRPGPIPEVDQSGEKVGPDLVAAPVLREELPVHRDLVLRSGTGSEDRALSEPRVDVLRTD